MQAALPQLAVLPHIPHFKCIALRQVCKVKTQFAAYTFGKAALSTAYYAHQLAAAVLQQANCRRAAAAAVRAVAKLAHASSLQHRTGAVLSKSQAEAKTFRLKDSELHHAASHHGKAVVKLSFVTSTYTPT